MTSRFDQLVSLLPKGKAISKVLGDLRPFQDEPHEFTISVGASTATIHSAYALIGVFPAPFASLPFPQPIIATFAEAGGSVLVSGTAPGGAAITNHSIVAGTTGPFPITVASTVTFASVTSATNVTAVSTSLGTYYGTGSFRATLNGHALADAIPDYTGYATVRTKDHLPPGEYTLRLESRTTTGAGIPTVTRQTFFTVKHLATILAMYADVLETLFDDPILDMSDAIGVDTVPFSYADGRFGLRVHQSDPSTSDQVYTIETYRFVLQTLLVAYRNFGAHPEGLRLAVESLTGVSPFVVPREWRPLFVPNSDLTDDGDQKRVRWSTALDDAAGIDLPNINSASLSWIHAAASGTVTTSLGTPPHPQKLTVTSSTACTVTITGTDEAGAALVEAVVRPSAGTGVTVNLFTTVTQYVVTTGTASVGVAESRFCTIDEIGPYNNMAASSLLLGADHTGMQWVSSGAIEVNVEEDGEHTLRDRPRVPLIHGRVEVTPSTGTFDLNPLAAGAKPCNYFDQITIRNNGLDKRIDIDATGPAAAPTIANVCTDLSAGSPPWTATECTGNQGDNNSVIKLTATGTPEGPERSLGLIPAPSDGSLITFALPRTSSFLVSIAAGPPRLTLLSTARMPTATSTNSYRVRVRGLKRGSPAGADDGVLAGSTGIITNFTSASYTFTASDVGASVRISGGAGNNDGIHRIFSVVTGTARLINEGSLAFTNQTTRDWSLWSPGEVATVIANDGVDELTLDSSLAFAWPAFASVDVETDSPYLVMGTTGQGTLDVTIDRDFEPSGFAKTDTVVVTGSVAPDNWTYGTGILTGSDVSNKAGTGGQPGFLGPSRLLLRGTGGSDPQFKVNVPIVAEAYRGMPIRYSVWTQEHSATAQAYEIAVSFDNEATWIVATTGTSTAAGSWPLNTSVLKYTKGIAATGTITTDAGPPIVSGDNFTINDGINTATTFEYRSTGIPTAGRIPINFTAGATAAAMALLTQAAINGVGPTLRITAGTPAGAVIPLTNDVLGTAGNQSSSESVSGVFAVTSMAGGAAETPIEGPLDPSILTGIVYTPYNATTAIVRLTRANGGTGTITVEKLVVSSLTGTGLWVGRQTVVRNAKRSAFGEILYIWSPEELSSGEKSSLGVPDSGTLPPPYGHVDYITNANGYWERADVSEYLVGVPLNVFGTFGAVDWLAADLVNLEPSRDAITGEAFAASPDKLSTVSPTRSGTVEEESLTVDPAFGTATISLVSNHEGTFPQDPVDGEVLLETKVTDTTVTTEDGFGLLIPAGTPIPVPHETV